MSRGGRGPIAAIVLLLLAVPGFADTAGDLLTVGKRAFADGEYSLAVTSFQRVAAEFPESVGSEEAEYMLGVSQFYAGNPADSIDSFASFRNHHPQSNLLSRSQYWSAAASVRLGRSAEALAMLAGRPSAANDPYRLPALMLTGVAQESLGRVVEAASTYRKILGDPSAGQLGPEAAFRLAGIEYRAAHFAAARDLYSQVLIDSPQSPFARDSVFFLGESARSLGDLADAAKRYQTVISLYPDSPYREAALFRAAEIAWRQKNDGAAQEALDALQKEFPAGAYRGSGLRLRSDILFAVKKYDQALAGYNAALDALADGVEKQAAWYSRGMVQLQLGRRADAAGSFQKAGAGVGTLTAEKAGFQRALLIANEGSTPDAVSALTDFLDAFPRSTRVEDATVLLASLLEKQGDEQGAFARWDALVRAFPRSSSLSEYLFRRGSAGVALGKEAAALDDFQRVMKEFPKSGRRNESAYSIGYVYTQRGEYPRALPYFQAVDASAGAVAERARLSLGISYFDMGNFDKALVALRALQAGNPGSVSPGTIGLYIGRTCYRLERLGDAETALRDAAVLLDSTPDPDGPSHAADARWWLAWALLRQQKLEQARDAFLAVAALPADPRRSEAYFRAGVCETLRHDDAAALTLFEDALALPPPDAANSGAPGDVREQILYEKAWALARLGRQPEAAQSFDTLAREYPDGRLAPQAFFSLAEKAFDAKRYGEAHEGFQRVAHDFPRSTLAAQALYLSGESLRDAGDASGALDAYWSCLATGPQGGLLLSAVQAFDAAVRAQGSIETARAFSDRAAGTRGLAPEAVAGIRLAYADMLLASDPAGARAVLTEVRGAAPPEPFAGEADLLLGRCYAAEKDWNRALDTLGVLAGTRADDVGARAALERARTLESMGRTSEAVEEFLKVSYLFPDYPDLAAESVYNAARVARARGDVDRAGKIEQTLRTSFPNSPWIEKLGGPLPAPPS